MAVAHRPVARWTIRHFARDWRSPVAQQLHHGSADVDGRIVGGGNGPRRPSPRRAVAATRATHVRPRLTPAV